ncbi:MAG: hypothetical protein LBD16_05775 [Oscillospiraceae bacterium]|jgi:hypothetical protein|nr:hypothetical protein [Oscillospiraceae bacterium]
MKKSLALALCFLAICITSAAFAAPITLPEYQLVAEFPEGWTVVTSNSATVNDAHAALLGTTRDLAAAIMLSEDKVIAAFAPGNEVSISVFMTQTETSALYFDIARYTTDMRNAIKADYENVSLWKTIGFRFTEAVWKNPAATGRMLRLVYNRRESDVIVARGLMAFTVHNGREITFQIEAKGRYLTSKETTAFEDFLKTVKHTPELAMPQLPTGLAFASPPPTELAKETLKFSGTTEPGAKVTVSVMKKGDNAPFTLDEETAKASGAFSVSAAMPGEGDYTLIITSELEGFVTTSIEQPLSFASNRIPINLTRDLSGEIWDAQPRFAGTTLPGVVFTVSENTEKKKVTADGSGKFSSKLNQQPEGTRIVTVTATLRGYPERQITYSFDRKWDSADYSAYLDTQKKTIAYATLVGSPEKQEGKVVRYDAEVISSESVDGVTYVLVKTSAGKNPEEVCIAIPGEADLQPGSAWRFWGTVAGRMYTGTPEVGDTAEPAQIPLVDYLLHLVQ